MNENIKKEWVTALRSGQYKQTKGTLQDCTGAYCCLGVLTSIYMQYNTRASWVVQDGEKAFRGSDGKVEHCALLPNEVRVWSGLVNSDPLFKAPKHIAKEGHCGCESPEANSTLSECNDGLNESFNLIADRIEFGKEIY